MCPESRLGGEHKDCALNAGLGINTGIVPWIQAGGAG